MKTSRKFLNYGLVALLWLLATSASAQVFRGWHDSSNFAESNREAYGWACVTGQTNPLTIKFYDGQNYVGETIADVQRESAVANVCGGVSSSLHGFVWPYPNSLNNGSSHDILAKAVVNGVEISIPGSPVSLNNPVQQRSEGVLDFITPEYAWGWACDPTSVQESNNPIEVTLYDEGGRFLGYNSPLITSATGVANICGASNRSYQIEFPNFIQDYQSHTIFAYATNANGSAKRLIGMHRAIFIPQSTSILGIQRSATPENIDDIIGASVIEELPPSDGQLRLNSYCYGPLIDDEPISWDPSPFTGFFIEDHGCNISTKICKPTLRNRFQRGLTDTFGEVVIQARESEYGIFMRSNGLGHNSACGDIAGSGPGFSWYPNSPTPWPDSSQATMGREIFIKFNASVNWSNGISYVHPSIYFRDRVRNQFVWVTVQAFDTRPGVPDELVTTDGSPIVVTSFNKNGTYGRIISGAFTRGSTMGDTHFEYRVNGYQFSQVLIAAGCGSTSLVSCNAADFDMTIAFVEVETASANAEIGAKVRDLDVGITNIGAF